MPVSGDTTAAQFPSDALFSALFRWENAEKAKRTGTRSALAAGKSRRRRRRTPTSPPGLGRPTRHRAGATPDDGGPRPMIALVVIWVVDGRAWPVRRRAPGSPARSPVPSSVRCRASPAPQGRSRTPASTRSTNRRSSAPALGGTRARRSTAAARLAGGIHPPLPGRGQLGSCPGHHRSAAAQAEHVCPRPHTDSDHIGADVGCRLRRRRRSATYLSWRHQHRGALWFGRVARGRIATTGCRELHLSGRSRPPPPHSRPDAVKVTGISPPPWERRLPGSIGETWDSHHGWPSNAFWLPAGGRPVRARPLTGYWPSTSGVPTSSSRSPARHDVHGPGRIPGLPDQPRSALYAASEFG